jgi:hypothetical protein
MESTIGVVLPVVLFMKTCMEQRGYRLIRASDLPLDIKRQEPDAESAVPIDRSWGIAGRLSP